MIKDFLSLYTLFQIIFYSSKNIIFELSHQRFAILILDEYDIKDITIKGWGCGKRNLNKTECRNAAKDLGHEFLVSGLPPNGEILFPPACSILPDKGEVYYNKNLKTFSHKFNRMPSDTFVERRDRFNAGHNNGYFKSVCKKDEIGITMQLAS